MTVRPRPCWAALVAAVALAAAACGSDGGTSAPTAPPTSGGAAGATRSGTALETTRLSLAKINGLSGPIALAVRTKAVPDDDSLYVAEKNGRVRRVVHGQGGAKTSVDAKPVLDLTSEVSTGPEQGLLGLAFASGGDKMYVDYTDRAGDTQVVEYAFRDGTAAVASRRVVLSVDQPFPNHNGGEVTFGPDGMLYVGLGDGGSENDPNMVGQNLGTPLSKILRVDPTPSGDKAYTVPPDNPFVGRAGALPETYAWGLRNPWRFTWDRENDNLWIADVGQDRWEEVDFRTPADAAGANFGWSLMDATHPFHGSNPPDGVLPILEYTHDNANCSITGGYVYRGTHIPTLKGVYVYGDYCSGKVWGLVQAEGRVAEQRELIVGASHPIFSFGQDDAGEMYLLAADGLYRIQPA
ncbi:MAG: PQQ-dependent sugar dehydrogenase [Actinomycetota bacterium]|nr:PQQ-dependent sugar dehydrogenase [Actinomycetota bacterium]